MRARLLGEQELDEIYYVIVSGRYGSAGDFSLEIEVSDGFELPLALFRQLFLMYLFLMSHLSFCATARRLLGERQLRIFYADQPSFSCVCEHKSGNSGRV
jgi:hypothetical protein